MSEPAIQTQSHPDRQADRHVAGPLRDWLATLSRIEAADQGRAAPRPAQPAAAPKPAEARRPAEPQGGWEPRLVQPAPAETQAREVEDEDVAALMAENMVLKARLKVEAERHEELQAIVAQELRALRSHVQAEVERAEELRAERDLWMARAEALAMPLFQKR
ncbi:hypothetical protein [Methylobacterium isbiliense]|uniref:ATPase n=1 Tax=Methylobacterium isbiliense TaxID=315478 RepID=A0ABQ4S4W0_9HYPH|nr:hypothetical protein [Methylobacterium isbiliense]MDN3624797.1 hypothetical protein [Methylobacterium isbiliense]GJD98168.1 hypothetical protein GMJLKIPL_0075 [Methylobacterium isbiliense]